jgi:hypothetical protein
MKAMNGGEPGGGVAMAFAISGRLNIVQTMMFCRREIIAAKPDRTMKIQASTVTKLERLPVAFISSPKDFPRQ